MVWCVQGATQQQKDLIEQASSMAAQDNMELACAFIQKTAIEKAIPEIDKHLITVSFFFHSHFLFNPSTHVTNSSVKKKLQIKNTLDTASFHFVQTRDV